MDIFKFHAELLDWLEHHDDDVVRILYESTTKILGHETNELKVAEALVDTAYILLYSATAINGPQAFTELLERKMDTFKRAKTATEIEQRTRAIEQVSQ